MPWGTSEQAPLPLARLLDNIIDLEIAIHDLDVDFDDPRSVARAEDLHHELDRMRAAWQCFGLHLVRR